MTWHLKDRELEKKLIEMCPNFIECIEDAIQTKEKDTNYIYVEFDREREGDTLGFNYLYFWDGELEEVPEYNPNDWNEYPKVTPSENIPMRVETESGGYIYRECAIFNEGVWKCERDGNADEELYGHVKRFRPWED